MEKCIFSSVVFHLMHMVGIGTKMEFIVHAKNSVDWLNEYHVHVNNNRRNFFYNNFISRFWIRIQYELTIRW